MPRPRPEITRAPGRRAPPTTEMFFTSSAGTWWRFWRYAGSLKLTQAFPPASSHTRTLSGRSIAMVGAASITGVPALGLPKMRSLVGGIFNPAFSASPLWSTRAKSAIPFDFKIAVRLCVCRRRNPCSAWLSARSPLRTSSLLLGNEVSAAAQLQRLRNPPPGNIRYDRSPS